MNKTEQQTVLDQQKKFFESLKKHKALWGEIFCFLMEYKKQLNKLIDPETKESAK